MLVVSKGKKGRGVACCSNASLMNNIDIAFLCLSGFFQPPPLLAMDA
jgi:hypothetical protein